MGGKQLVLDEADNDLNDGPGNTAADQLPGKRRYIESRRSVSHGSTEQSSKQLSAANTTDRAGDQISNVSEIRILEDLATSGSAGSTTNQLCENSFHRSLHFVKIRWFSGPELPLAAGEWSRTRE
ncbi:hypothetical protein [Agaricicola taiwanensis]|uniref:hypothetical protein n=1 Tax=Agaricicola taiwanensis TaxID=591372 RepID=UPI001662F7D2|nr:hypothetical protein [Agaricicola taiwanensis]